MHTSHSNVNIEEVNISNECYYNRYNLIGQTVLAVSNCGGKLVKEKENRL